MTGELGAGTMLAIFVGGLRIETYEKKGTMEKITYY